MAHIAVGAEINEGYVVLVRSAKRLLNGGKNLLTVQILSADHGIEGAVGRFHVFQHLCQKLHISVAAAGIHGALKAHLADEQRPVLHLVEEWDADFHLIA